MCNVLVCCCIVYYSCINSNVSCTIDELCVIREPFECPDLGS